MNIFYLQTARAGSKSVPNKNKLQINGTPMFLYNCLYGNRSRYIKHGYISTDDADIKTIAREHSVQVIDRPDYLSTDTASHYSVIMHGLQEIEKRQKVNVDILVILLGNNMDATTSDLDEAINKVVEGKNVDSCMSVSKFNMFNPYRAFSIQRGKLETTIHQMSVSSIVTKDSKGRNEKDAFGDIYFFNGSFWVCKRHAVVNNSGLQPFPWLGKNIVPLVQREGVMEVDAQWQADYYKGVEK